MAIQYKFTCSADNTDFLSVQQNEGGDKVYIDGEYGGMKISFAFDVSTAIKFSKTIRTEINNIKEYTDEG